MSEADEHKADTPVVIRARRESDLQAVTAIHNMPRARWGTLSTPFTSEARQAKRMAENQDGLVTLLVVCVDGVVVGEAALIRNKQPRLSHAASIGIMLHDDWQGRGIGSKLFAAILDVADNWLGLRRLELDVYTDNAPAIALYKKFGFQIEALERQDAFRDGTYADSYAMARLRGDLPRDEAPYPQAGVRAERAEFTLRAAEITDLDAITEMMNQPAVRHGTLATPFTTPEALKHLADPAEPATRSIVAVVEGAAVGIGILQPFAGRKAHMGYISLLAVHDAWQGHGIGGALLAALLDLADNWLNLQRVTLSAMADNAPAIKLYERFGFATEGIRRADVFRAGAFVDSCAMARLRG
jgi:putative acetyltransferase